MYFSKGNRAPLCPSSLPLATVMQAIIGNGGHIGRDMALMGGLGGTTAVAVTFSCLFWRLEQEVRKVAIWWVFISWWLPEWLNVSWRWSCRQLRGRAGPEAWGLVPSCSSSPLKEGQQSNESHQTYSLFSVSFTAFCCSSQRLAGT